LFIEHLKRSIWLA